MPTQDETCTLAQDLCDVLDRANAHGRAQGIASEQQVYDILDR